MEHKAVAIDAIGGRRWIAVDVFTYVDDNQSSISHFTTTEFLKPNIIVVEDMLEKNF